MRDKEFGIHAGSSFRQRSRSDAEMSEALAIEAQQIVRNAAQPVESGETVKAQMRRAWAALGRPPFWRVRAAWYGAAGSWSAAAFDDLRDRYDRWAKRMEVKGRARADNTREQLAALRAQLAHADPDFHRDTIAQVDETLRRLGGEGIDMGDRDRAGDFREQ